jgi:hypothetical protein
LPGRTPTEAVTAFLLPIQEAVACVARAKITLSPNGRAMTGRIHALALNDGTPVALKCKPVLLLEIGMLYEIVRAQERTDRGAWRVSTRGYMYELQTSSGELVWSYHWHPTSRIQSPHAHIGSAQLAPDAVLSYRAHYPTGRISLESVIRTCIAEYGVTAMNENWEQDLAARERDFEEYRTW